MNDFIRCLKQRISNFQINTIVMGNVNSMIKQQLINNPDVLSVVDSFSYSYVVCGNRYELRFSVSYKNDRSKLTIVIKDEFELLTAITMILKSHKDMAKIIIDNGKKFTSKNTILQHIHTLERLTGVEFELSQRSTTNFLVYSFLDEELLVCELTYKYFDSAMIVNKLSFVVAEHVYSVIHLQEPISIINYLLDWFRSNIKYKNNNLQSDHSAVGLIKNGTAVCQGIAVYAYLFLNAKGIKTRYVFGLGNGMGEWGNHAWNLVYVNDVWKHIDYTFELNSINESVLKPLNQFRVNHKWDIELYSDDYSDKIKKVYETMSSSIVNISPNQMFFSVNGCVVYIPDINTIAPVYQNKIYVSISDIFPIFNGCYSTESNIAYFNARKYEFNFQNSLFLYGKRFIPIEDIRQFGFDVFVNKTSITLKRV